MLVHTLLAVLAMARAETVKVMMIHNAAEGALGWREGFYDFWVPYFNNEMDAGPPVSLEVSLCESGTLDLSTVQSCFQQADVDAIVVGSTVLVDEIKAAAEDAQIPNLHCSDGAAPTPRIHGWLPGAALWTPTRYSFGVQLPHTFHSRTLLDQASSLGLRSVVILRSSGAASAAAALEWSRQKALRVVGPTLAWCQSWSLWTRSCRKVAVLGTEACRCGEQSEFDALGLPEYQLDAMPSFYEVSEELVVEDGFDSAGEFVSPSLVAFVEAIIEDVRSQGADPEVVLNFLTSSSSALQAMKQKSFGYKIYFTGNHLGAQSFWSNGTVALTAKDAMYHVSGGQWHPEMDFADPYFGSSQRMITRYEARFGRVPSSDAVACVAAGISLSFGLQSYGSLEGLNASQRRQELRYALGRLNDDTVFGKIRFNRFNQNTGRSSVNWQVLEDETIRPVLPAGAPEIFRFPSPSWEVRSLGCPAGTYAPVVNTTSRVPLECVQCQEGTFRSASTAPLEVSQCEQCAVGQGGQPGETGLIECRDCPPGRFQNGALDKGVCNLCPRGRFRSGDSDNSTEGCEVCAPQSFADELGLTACKPCPLGTLQPEVGQSFCICDIGSFAVTAGACRRCDDVLSGSTTEHRNSKSSEDCICPPGTFWHRPSESSSLAFCKECREPGLVCRGGRSPGNSSAHQAPFQAAGYSAGKPKYLGGDPTYIVTCTSEIRCPELPVGQCPGANMGIGCVTCLPNHYDDNGICRSCSDSPFSVWPLIVAVLLVLVGLLVLYKFSTSLDRTSRDSMATIILGAGFVLVILQDVPDFRKIQVEWIEPMKTFRTVLSFLTMDIDLLRPGCWMRARNPLGSYIGSIACYPLGALLVLALLGIAKYFKADLTWNEAITAIGVLLGAFYIALISLALRPFKCVGNPDGTASMVYYREIRCWQDDVHWVMIFFSMVTFISVVVTFYALTLWTVLNYSAKVARSGGVKFVKRFSFFFGRFNPPHYYFVLILNTRNLLIACIPVLLQMHMELLFLAFVATLSVYAVLQAHIWPWRTWLSNVLDAGLSIVLISAVAMAIVLLEFDVARQTIIIQVMSMLSSLVLMCCVVFMMGITAYRAYRPKRNYGIFLSHHKLGAAVLARWFKMLLSEYITDRIFLDSDDVSKLDAILDVTSWDTLNVVVLMTSETMKRMWCAAEVASAWDSGNNLVLVSCDGNRITTNLIDEIPHLWSDQQQATLAATGVNIDMIVGAYEDLLTAPVIPLVRKGARTEPHHDAVKEVIGACVGLTRKVLPSLTMRRTMSFTAPSQAQVIYLIGDVGSPEPGCCCRVIQSMLQSALQEMVTVINPSQAVLDMDSLKMMWEDAKAILVVLTAGVLHDSTFAGAMSMCPESKWSVLVPIKADEQFAYPDPSFWETLLEGHIFSAETLAAMQTDFDRVKKTYTTLFNVLALKFTAHGSAHILATEILVLKGRLMPLIHDQPEIARLESEKRFSKLRSMSFVESSDRSLGRQGSKGTASRRPTNIGVSKTKSLSSGETSTSGLFLRVPEDRATASRDRTSSQEEGIRHVLQTTMNGQTVQIIKEQL